MALFNKKKKDVENKDISSLSTIPVVTPRSWFLLAIAGLVCAAIGFWALFGNIPVTIQGKGIIVSRSGLAGHPGQNRRNS